MQCLNNLFAAAISCSPTTLSNSTTNSSSLRRPTCGARRIRGSQEACSDSEIGSKKSIYLPSNVQTITSTSNPFVKHCVKLRQNSSYRCLHGSVLLVGTTPIREICVFHKAVLDRPTFECLFVLEHSHIPAEITQSAARVVHVSPEVINKISGVLTADSVDIIALARIPSTFHVLNNSAHQEDFSALFTSPRRILVLDGIQDPGNLGTLIRSAKAFKWDGVFLLPGCCDPFNDKALRACRGACFQMPIVCGNWKHIETLRREFEMKMIAGHPGSSNGLNRVTTLSEEFAESVAETSVCLVLGSEGGGLSEFSRKACELVSIPMAGEFESLNVSVAGGILMYMLQSV